MDPKTSSANLPGVPAPGGNPPPVQPTPKPVSPATPAVAPALPAGNVAATKATVAAAGGNRGGRPRLDGLPPGSPEALAKDRAKDAEYQKNKRAAIAAAKASVRAVAPLPSAPTTSPSEAAGNAPGSGLVSMPAFESLDWQAADAAPVVVALVDAGEAWDEWDNRSIIAPLRLDAAAQSRILSGTRWPEKHKLTVIKSLPAPTAKLLNLIHVPRAAKDYVEGIPALALLVKTIMDNKKDLRALVENELAKRDAKPAPTEPEKKA